MTIYAYDPINTKVDYNKTYINFKTGLLYSKEFKTKNYVFLANRLNINSGVTEVFVVFTNTKPNNNAKFYTVSKDCYNRVKIPIHSILSKIEHDDNILNINISIDDEDNDAIAYKILEY